MRVKIVLALVVLAIVAIGCQPLPPDQGTTHPKVATYDAYWNEYEQVGNYTFRIIDRELDVVCYLYRGYGISCVPLGGK